MRLAMSPSELHCNIYNGLASIEAANEVAKAENKIEDFLSRSQRLFLSHNVHSRFGVALLHQHYFCKSGEIVVQNEELLGNENVLVSQPRVYDAAKETSIPWLWGVTGEDFHPLEFTTDSLARELLVADSIPGLFLKDFKELVRATSAERLFGLAVVERSFFEQAKPGDSAIEYSDAENRRNNIYLRERRDTEKLIETTWVFQEEAMSMSGCIAKSDCATTIRTVCRVRCPKDDGVHSPIHFPDEQRHHTVRHEHSS
jgi:hypothetical protein